MADRHCGSAQHLLRGWCLLASRVLATSELHDISLAGACHSRAAVHLYISRSLSPLRSWCLLELQDISTFTGACHTRAAVPLYKDGAQSRATGHLYISRGLPHIKLQQIITCVAGATTQLQDRCLPSPSCSASLLHLVLATHPRAAGHLYTCRCLI